PLPDVPAPAAWVAGAMPPTVSDVTVLATGPRRRPPSAVLKLPRTDAATRSLRRQDSVLARLHADPRLGEWRRLLPVLLAGGELCVATVHGDFTPGNILMAPDGATVTGIIDWTEAAVADVPLLDLVTLLLSTRMHVQRRELGAVVVEALTSACGERVEFSL